MAANQNKTEIPIQRHFTRAGEDPFATVRWERRTAKISGDGGEVVFEQPDVEMPEDLVADRHQRRRRRSTSAVTLARRSASRA